MASSSSSSSSSSSLSHPAHASSTKSPKAVEVAPEIKYDMSDLEEFVSCEPSFTIKEQKSRLGSTGFKMINDQIDLLVSQVERLEGDKSKAANFVRQQLSLAAAHYQTMSGVGKVTILSPKEIVALDERQRFLYHEAHKYRWALSPKSWAFSRGDECFCEGAEEEAAGAVGRSNLINRSRCLCGELYFSPQFTPILLRK